MAGTGGMRIDRTRQNARRPVRQNRRGSAMSAGYEDGSALRVPEWIPGEERQNEESPEKRRRTGTQKKRRSAKRTRRARTAAAQRARGAASQRIGAGYVAFLMLICVLSVFLCVHFLQLKAQVTTQTARIAAMETQLSRLRQDNEAYYKKTIASVTLEEVKDAALNRLGMHYPSEDQIRYYTTTENSYVRQYAAIPEAADN